MSIKIQHHGEERTVDATEEEMRIFEIIKELFPDDKIVMARKSSNYVSAICHGNDVARFKYTQRAKWIQLPYILDDKVKLSDPEDVRDIKADLERAVDTAKSF